MLRNAAANWAAPGPIGSTTPAAGTFTTLTATTALKTNQSATVTFQYGATVNDQVAMNSTGTFFGQTNAGGTKYQFVLASQPIFRLSSDSVIGLNSTATLSTGAIDTGIARNAAGVVEINTGTAGTLAALKATALNGTGAVTAFSATAVPAGGTAGTGVLFSSTANLGVFFGSGVPTLSAAQGSLYVRTDGSSSSTRLYVNTNGTTGWTNVTTAA